ncbi:Peptide deformylase [Pediococcus damnosus]|nr:Peptide deformylase [Pediococcus damnosus]AMV64624.1 Peptide deformylase [Pediococcus damnosus]
MIKPINRNQSTLSKKADQATKADRQTVTDLLDTLKAHQADCVGMAANMIGINKRIIVVQMGPLAIPMINPVITKKIDPFTTKEGCLSLLGERSTTRYKKLKLLIWIKSLPLINNNFPSGLPKLSNMKLIIVKES